MSKHNLTEREEEIIYFCLSRGIDDLEMPKIESQAEFNEIDNLRSKFEKE